MDIEIRCRRLTRPPDETALDEAVAQVWSVDSRHGSTPTPWARRMLRYAHTVDATWVQAEMDERLVGCIAVLGDENVRKMTLVGRDPSVPHVYFQLIYAAVRCAIEERAHVLWGGSGVYRFKQNLGFQLQDNNHAAFAGVGTLPHTLGRAIARLESRIQGESIAATGSKGERSDQ
jgi:hypothetical protein